MAPRQVIVTLAFIDTKSFLSWQGPNVLHAYYRSLSGYRELGDEISSRITLRDDYTDLYLPRGFVEQGEADEFTRIREEKLSIAFLNELSKVVPPTGVFNNIRLRKVQGVPKAACNEAEN